jgi:hypothetical protein
MNGLPVALSLLLLGGITVPFAGGCAQNPSANTECVFESAAVQPGRCLTQCESQCGLEDRAGCASKNCVVECENAAAPLTPACADASYAHWRCLRIAGFPVVECLGGTASLVTPEGECHAERERERAACVTGDAGNRREGGN